MNKKYLSPVIFIQNKIDNKSKYNILLNKYMFWQATSTTIDDSFFLLKFGLKISSEIVLPNRIKRFLEAL